jgi:hypothetical protein
MLCSAKAGRVAEDRPFRRVHQRRRVTMKTYVIIRRRAWASPEVLQRVAARSRRIGDEEMSDRIRWIRSYVTKDEDGTLGTACIYQAKDVESIREHARRVEMPADEIFEVADTVVVRPDPQSAEATEKA